MSGGHMAISVFHIFAVVPLFLYVAFVRGQSPQWIFPFLLTLGAIIALYHTYKVMVKWKANSPSVWVNIIHVLLVAPLLMYVGAKGFDTPRWAYELLAMAGFAALGYHIYSIVLEVSDMNSTMKGIKKITTADAN
jgi:hypothetical protein